MHLVNALAVFFSRHNNIVTSQMLRVDDAAFFRLEPAQVFGCPFNEEVRSFSSAVFIRSDPDPTMALQRQVELRNIPLFP